MVVVQADHPRVAADHPLVVAVHHLPLALVAPPVEADPLPLVSALTRM